MSSHVQSIVRVRPQIAQDRLDDGEGGRVYVSGRQCVLSPSNSSSGDAAASPDGAAGRSAAGVGRRGEERFTLRAVHDITASTHDVFDLSVRGVLDANLLRGVSVAILTLGAPLTGKSFTMLGADVVDGGAAAAAAPSSASGDSLGMARLAINHVFRSLVDKQRQVGSKMRYEVSVRCEERHHTKPSRRKGAVIDLLTSVSSADRQDNGGVRVGGVSVAAAEDALTLLQRAIQTRMYSRTGKDETALIYELDIVQHLPFRPGGGGTKLSGGEGAGTHRGEGLKSQTLYSTLTLVDCPSLQACGCGRSLASLAGAGHLSPFATTVQRLSRVDVDGVSSSSSSGSESDSSNDGSVMRRARQKRAKAAKKATAAAAAPKASGDNMPSSALTDLLTSGPGGGALGGNCVTIALFHLKPDRAHFENLNTLMYAEGVFAKIQNYPTVQDDNVMRLVRKARSDAAAAMTESSVLRSSGVVRGYGGGKGLRQAADTIGELEMLEDEIRRASEEKRSLYQRAARLQERVNRTHASSVGRDGKGKHLRDGDRQQRRGRSGKAKQSKRSGYNPHRPAYDDSSSSYSGSVTSTSSSEEEEGDRYGRRRMAGGGRGWDNRPHHRGRRAGLSGGAGRYGRGSSHQVGDRNSEQDKDDEDLILGIKTKLSAALKRDAERDSELRKIIGRGGGGSSGVTSGEGPTSTLAEQGRLLHEQHTNVKADVKELEERNAELHMEILLLESAVAEATAERDGVRTERDQSRQALSALKTDLGGLQMQLCVAEEELEAATAKRDGELRLLHGGGKGGSKSSRRKERKDVRERTAARALKEFALGPLHDLEKERTHLDFQAMQAEEELKQYKVGRQAQGRQAECSASSL